MPTQEMLYRMMVLDQGAAAAFTGLSQKARLAATATQDLTAASLRAADAEKIAADAAQRAAVLRLQASQALSVAKDREIAGDAEGSVAAREAADALRLQASAAAVTSRELNANAAAAVRQAAAIRSARDATKLHATSIRGLIGETTGLASALESVPTPVTVVAGALGKLGIAAVGAGAAIAAFSIDQAVKFQTAMARLHTQANVSNRDVAALSKGIEQMAGAVASAPQDLAAAAYHIASVGQNSLTTAQELRVLKIAAEGAKIGGADLVDVTNALDAAVVSGIKGVHNYSETMGVLNKTVGAGDMSMQDLAEAFGPLGAVLKGYNVTIQQAGAALAVFGDNNLRGAQAGTALRMAVQAMVSPTQAGSAQLEAWGIKAGNLSAQLQHGGLTAALDTLMARMRANGVTAKEQGDILTQAFGKRAGVGLSVLEGELGRFHNKLGEVGAAGGGFAKSWTGYTKTFQYNLDSAKAGLESMAIALGTKLLPEATKAMHWIATKGVADLQRFGDWFTAHEATLKHWAKVAEEAFKLMAQFWMQNVRVIEVGFDLLTGRWGKAWNVIKSQATQSIGQLGVVFKAFADTAGGLLYDAGKNIVEGLINGIESMAGALIGEVESLAGKVTSPFKKVLSIFSPSKVFHGYGVNIVQGLVGGVKSKLADAGSVSQLLAEGMISGWTGAAARIKDALSTPIQNALSHFTDRLAADLTRQQNDLNKTVSAYKALEKARSSAIGSLKSSIVGSTDVTGVLGATNQWGQSYTGNIGQSLSSSAALLKREAHGLAQLRKMGLSQALLSQISAASPQDAVTLIQQILSGQDGSIASLNRNESLIQTYAKQSATTVVESPHEKAQLRAARDSVFWAKLAVSEQKIMCRHLELIAAREISRHIVLEVKGGSLHVSQADAKAIVAAIERLDHRSGHR